MKRKTVFKILTEEVKKGKKERPSTHPLSKVQGYISNLA